MFLSPRFDSRPSIKRHLFLDQDTAILGHPVIDQIDIVPTLASLFGFPIPKNNLGKIICDLYPNNNGKQRRHTFFFRKMYLIITKQ